MTGRSETLELTVRTPHEVVLERSARSLRLPTRSGQVGVRPHVEPLVLAVESGLVLVRLDDGELLVGTAGGLFRSDGRTASLLTPLAVSGVRSESVLEALEALLGQPNSELEARAAFSRLQRNILRELRQSESSQPGRLEANGTIHESAEA